MQRRVQALPQLLVVLLALGSAVVVLAGMSAMRAVLGGLFLALMMVVVIGPVELWLVRKGLPGWAAFLIVLLGVVVAVGGVLLLMAVSVSTLVNTLPQYGEQLARFRGDVQSALQSLGFGADAASSTSQRMVNPDTLIQGALGVTRWVVTSVTGFVFMLFLFVFMLLDVNGFGSRLAGLVSRPTYDHFVAFVAQLRKWLVLTSILNAMTAVANIIFLLYMGVEFALLWGILSFFLGFIPNIGFVLSLIGPAVFALLQFGLSKAIFVIVVFIVMNGMVNNLVQPRLMGHGLDLQPFMLMFSVLLWAFILGPIGALLSVPLTLAVRFLIESWSDTAPLAKLVAMGRGDDTASDGGLDA